MEASICFKNEFIKIPRSNYLSNQIFWNIDIFALQSENFLRLLIISVGCSLMEVEYRKDLFENVALESSELSPISDTNLLLNNLLNTSKLYK